MNKKVMLSTGNTDWQTPLEELRKWERELNFYTALDPCTTPDNPLGAPKFYSIEEDGLEQSWDVSDMKPRIQSTFEYVGDGKKEREVAATGSLRIEPAVYANPGYGRGLGKWIKKAYFEHQRHGSMIVMLLPLRAPRWFHDYILPYLRTVENPLDHYINLRGRIKFVGAKDAAPFDSVLWIQKKVKI